MDYLDDFVCGLTCEEMYRDDYDEEWDDDPNDYRAANPSPVGSYAWFMGY